MERIRALCIGVLIVTIAGACETNDPLQSQRQDTGELILELPNARVVVIEHDIQVSPVASATFHMKVQAFGNDPSERVLTVRRSEDSLTSGTELLLCTEDGEMLAGATQRWGMSSTGKVTYYMRECTSQDTLELRAGIEGSTITEAYYLNGDRFETQYEPDSEIAQSEGNRFWRFYESHGARAKFTLNYNDDGRLMMALISNESFLSWATHVTQSIHGSRVRGAETACDADCICGIASLCSFFKCQFGGGIANFLCDACVGTSLACAIAAFF